MNRQPWEDFASVTSKSFVKELVPQAQNVAHDDLIDMQLYRKRERVETCGGYDPIRALLAYAQNELIYDDKGTLVTAANRTAYDAVPRERRLNKFGLAYMRTSKLYLHKTLADIVVGAAIHLYLTQGWTTVLYDGLRTMEGAFKLYNFAKDSDIEGGLLALPGQSAHNKGLAVDSMMTGMHGVDVEVGGHFDHLDMAANSRVYLGDALTQAGRRNRILREIAFMRSALTQGLLIAPLRSEFWDDRLPENHEDLWRVLDSAARSIGLTLLTAQDEALRKQDRKAFSVKWENWSYEDFLNRWKETFRGQEAKLKETLGVTLPPAKEKIEFYHGNYNPIYDRDLKASGKNLTA